MEIRLRLAAAIPVLSLSLLLPAQSSPDPVRLYEHAHPYLNDSPDALKVQISGLGGLRTATAQEPLSGILEKAGEVLLQQVPRVPNLIAQEDVAAERLTRMNALQGGSRNQLQYLNFDEGRLTPQDWKRYEYIIMAEHGEDGGITFDESRREPGNSKGKTSTRGVGFGSLWLMFAPQHRDESKFRLLGTQTVNRRETYVVAFAQDPKLVKNPGTLELERGTVPLLYQGIAWIDQTTGNIVRLRTDLLSPLPSLELKQVTSTIEFSEVKIPKLDTPLFLPKQVEVLWNLNNSQMGELHRYNGYHLFHASSRILPLT